MNIESRHQQAVIKWFAFAHKGLGVPDQRLLMAFPLQAARTPRNGARMKSEGCRAGTPDLILAVARKGMHSLYIEMKAHGGKPSDNQREMIDLLLAQGHGAIVCFSAEEAMTAITTYLT